MRKIKDDDKEDDDKKWPEWKGMWNKKGEGKEGASNSKTLNSGFMLSC